jgi:hypothetical protein
LAALPDELRREVIAEQRRNNDRKSSSVDAEFLAAIPPELQAEVLAQNQVEIYIKF